jgi:hypothetical protein
MLPIPHRPDTRLRGAQPAPDPVRAATCDEAAIGPIGEFIDALNALRHGHVLVKVSDASAGWLLNGAVLYTAHAPLLHYGLVQAFDNRDGFEGVQYFRITARGHAVCRDALRRWKRLPLLQRLWLRAVA